MLNITDAFYTIYYLVCSDKVFVATCRKNGKCDFVEKHGLDPHFFFYAVGQCLLLFILFLSIPLILCIEEWTESSFFLLRCRLVSLFLRSPFLPISHPLFVGEDELDPSLYAVDQFPLQWLNLKNVWRSAVRVFFVFIFLFIVIKLLNISRCLLFFSLSVMIFFKEAYSQAGKRMK